MMPWPSWTRRVDPGAWGEEGEAVPMAHDITKLPRWAQEHIRKLEMQRDAAVDALNEFVDAQTESPIYYEQTVCTGENDRGGPSFKRRYVQTHGVTVEWRGVELDVRLRENGIDLQWAALDGRHREPIGFVPSNHQSGRLPAIEERD